MTAEQIEELSTLLERRAVLLQETGRRFAAMVAEKDRLLGLGIEHVTTEAQHGARLGYHLSTSRRPSNESGITRRTAVDAEHVEEGKQLHALWEAWAEAGGELTASTVPLAECLTRLTGLVWRYG